MKLYNAKTKVLKRVIKRHMNKFPERYMFQLTKNEFDNLKSQFGTSNLNNYYVFWKISYVFIE